MSYWFGEAKNKHTGWYSFGPGVDWHSITGTPLYVFITW